MRRGSCSRLPSNEAPVPTRHWRCWSGWTDSRPRRCDRRSSADRRLRAILASRYPHQTAERGRGFKWIAAGVACGFVAGAFGLALLWSRGVQWVPIIGPPSSPPLVTQPAGDALPVPRAADTWIARARALHGKGRLREALVALDALRPDDPDYAQAEELRATIQRQLLTAARSTDGRLLASPSTPDPNSR